MLGGPAAPALKGAAGDGSLIGPKQETTGVDKDLALIASYVRYYRLSNEAVMKLARLESKTTAAGIGKPGFNPTVRIIRKLLSMIPEGWSPPDATSTRPRGVRVTPGDESDSIVLQIDPDALPTLDKGLARALAYLRARAGADGRIRASDVPVAEIEEMFPLVSVLLFEAVSEDLAETRIAHWQAPADFDGGANYSDWTVARATPDRGILACFLADLKDALEAGTPRLAVCKRRRRWVKPGAPEDHSYVFLRLLARIEGEGDVPQVLALSRRKEMRPLEALFPELRGGGPDQQHPHPAP